MENKIKGIVEGEVSFTFRSSDVGKQTNLKSMDDMINEFREYFYQLLKNELVNLEYDFVKISKFEMTREIEEVEEI